jgi:hypothetical protein
MAIAAMLVTALGAAVQASAATIQVNGACFLDSGMLTIAGSGFTPSAAVSYAFDGVASNSGAADTAGNLSQQIAAPVLSPDTIEHTYNLTATDQSNLANVGSTQVTITQLTATLTPKQAAPARKIRFSIHGMPPGVPVYLHYVYRKRSRATVSLGKPAAPCGTLVVRRRFFPMNHPSTGTWTFQFDDAKKYSTATRPAIRGKILLFRTSRSSVRAAMLR